jgi:hypothetical protein
MILYCSKIRHLSATRAYFHNKIMREFEKNFGNNLYTRDFVISKIFFHMVFFLINSFYSTLSYFLRKILFSSPCNYIPN